MVPRKQDRAVREDQNYENTLLPKPQDSSLTCEDLPTEMKVMISSCVSDSYTEAEHEPRNIRGQISLLHSGNRKLIVIRFRHPLDVRFLIVSKTFLESAVVSYVRNHPIQICEAREQFTRPDLSANTTTLFTGNYAARIRHLMISQAQFFVISNLISPVLQDFPISPPIWAPKLRSVDLNVCDRIYWTMNASTCENLETCFWHDPRPGDVRVLSYEELDDIVNKNKFPNGTERLIQIRQGYHDGNSWFMEVMPRFPKQQLSGHFHLYLSVRCDALVNGEPLPLALACKFEATTMKLIKAYAAWDVE